MGTIAFLFSIYLSNLFCKDSEVPRHTYSVKEIAASSAAAVTTAITASTSDGSGGSPGYGESDQLLSGVDDVTSDHLFLALFCVAPVFQSYSKLSFYVLRGNSGGACQCSCFRREGRVRFPRTQC